MEETTLDRIRESRMKLSEDFDNDIIKMTEHYIALQNEHPEKFYQFEIVESKEEINK